VSGSIVAKLPVFDVAQVLAHEWNAVNIAIRLIGRAEGTTAESAQAAEVVPDQAGNGYEGRTPT
jgi:hypothetical protein